MASALKSIVFISGVAENLEKHFCDTHDLSVIRGISAQRNDERATEIIGIH